MPRNDRCTLRDSFALSIQAFNICRKIKGQDLDRRKSEHTGILKEHKEGKLCSMGSQTDKEYSITAGNER